MTEKQKKALFAVFFIAASIGMGYFVYYVLFGPTPGTQTETEVPAEQVDGSLPRSNPGTAATGTSQATPGSLPSGSVINAPGANVTQTPEGPPPRNRVINSGVTQAVAPSADGNSARYYNPEDGRFYRVNPDGTVSTLGDKQFFNVKDVDWGKKKDQAIMEFPDGSNIYYDFTQKRQVELESHWEDFDFAPTDDRIIGKSIGNDVDTRYLIVANPDGTEAKALESLGKNADLVHPAWASNGQTVAYAMTGSPIGGNGQEIIFVGQNHENFKSLDAPGQDFLPNYSPTGKYLLFSVWNPNTNNKPNLWIVSGNISTIGAGRKNLQLNTWADKCAWAGDSDLYCGVPQDLPNDAGLQRQDFATLPDDIYHIDLITGSATKVNPPEQNLPIRSPVVSKDKKKLFYTDASTGKLYSYDLK